MLVEGLSNNNRLSQLKVQNKELDTDLQRLRMDTQNGTIRVGVL